MSAKQTRFCLFALSLFIRYTKNVAPKDAQKSPHEECRRDGAIPLKENCRYRDGKERKTRMYKREDVRKALTGSSDYHALMRSIAETGLKNKAGYKPKNTGEMILHKNLIHWQNPKYHINAGVLWVFYAVACGHFTDSEAKKIWRYGQALKLFDEMYDEFVRRYPRHKIMANWMRETMYREPLKYIKPFASGYTFDYAVVRKELDVDVWGNSVQEQMRIPTVYAVAIIAYLARYIQEPTRADWLLDLKTYRRKMQPPLIQLNGGR